MVAEHDATRVGDLFAQALGPIASGQVTANLELLKQEAADAVPVADLFAAGPTSHSAAMVARCEQSLADYQQAGKKPPRAFQAELDSWRRRHRVAQKRDRLHADRQAAFPGCICLGFGGRYPQQGLVIESTDGRLLTDPTVETFRDPCACPIGVAKHAEIAAAKQELLMEDQARRLRTLWDRLKLPQGLGETITLDTHVDQPKMALVRRWYAREFKAGLLIAGKAQRGKTTTAYLLARQAIRDGLGTVGLTVVDLIERLTDTFHHDERLKADPTQPPQTTHLQLIASLQAVPFLLLDDLGAEKLTDYVERALYQILNARAEGGLLTVITTNLRKEEILDRYGDRIYARIAKLCQRVVFEAEMLGPAAGGLQDLEDVGDA